MRASGTGARRRHLERARASRPARRERPRGHRLSRDDQVPARPTPRAFVDEVAPRIEAAAAGRHRWRMALAPHAPYSVSPSVFEALAAARPERCASRACRCTSRSRPRKSSSSGGGAAAGRDVLKRLGAWDPDWRRPRLQPGRVPRSARVLGRAARSRSTRSRRATTTWPAGASGRDAGDVPAQQRLRRRGRPARRGVLRVRRPRGRRHRQPVERGGPQPVRGAGRAPPDRARRRAVAPAAERDARRRRGARASASTHGAIAPRRAAPR